MIPGHIKLDMTQCPSQKEFTLPSHLKNKKIWGVSSQIENGSIMMMFQKFNMHQNDFQRIESNITTRIESFINGKIDGYTNNNSI